MFHENMQVEFEFGSGRIIFNTVMPLGLRKIQKNSNNGSQEYTDQVQIWFYLIYFQQCHAPCTYVSWF